MSRTEDLKKFLTRELKTICENVCYQQASDDIPFPYIVYDLSHKQYEVGKGYSIEINIWDRSTSTKKLANTIKFFSLSINSTIKF